MLERILPILADWIFNKIKGYVSAAAREEFARESTEKVIAEKMKPINAAVEEYERLLDKAQNEHRVVTKEERDEIRRKKIAAETDLWNS